MPRLAFLHTSFVLVEPVRALARQLLPGIQAFHVVDETLLGDILQAGAVTPGVARRIARLAIGAEEAGAAAVMLTCSSSTPCLPAVQALVRVPVRAIDEAMAEEAVRRAGRIGLLATVATTLRPTEELLRAKAHALGRPLEITAELCAAAFDAVLQGDRATHDALVTARCRTLAEKVELIVFAQGSMAPLARQLHGQIPVPILTSLEAGVRRAGEILRQQESHPR
ncbi:MAG: aspartate/glutamate racemase family protein [Candidatus Methylomirabilales bacterium]